MTRKDKNMVRILLESCLGSNWDTISHKVKYRRLCRDLSQRSLAELCNTTAGIVGDIESHNQFVSLKSLIAVLIELEILDRVEFEKELCLLRNILSINFDKLTRELGFING